MSTESSKGMKLSLKLMVDSKAKKVVFAEAGKDFVDFLFHILSLPLATVVKLLTTEEMIGGLPALYKSVESLKTECFQQNVNKDTVLLPKLSITLPLLSLHYAPATLTYYKCPDHQYATEHSGQICPRKSIYQPQTCCQQLAEVKCTYVVPPKPSNEKLGFVKEAVPYMVMDNLEVKPMTITLIKSLVSDFDYLVEEEVQFGVKEGLTLLRASLETNNVLTTVFLGRKRTLAG